MPVKVKCSQCDAVGNAPDAARGKAIKCPKCGGKIRVPAGKAKRPTPTSGASEESDDPMDFLGGMDLRRAENRKNRICPRCSEEVGPEDEVCEACGTDLETGLLTDEARRKKARRGPDCDLYPQKMWSESWAFLKNNWWPALLTGFYWFAAVGSIFGCVRTFMYSTGAPTKVYWGFMTTVSTLMPIGWTWLMATEVIKTTMKKKKKLEKIHKDVHLNGALGLKLVNWLVFFTMFVPLIAAILFLNDMPIPGAILAGVALLYAIPHAPVVMAHMSQPIQYKGWMPWIAGPQLVATLRGSMLWLLQAFAVLVIPLGGIIAVFAIWGGDYKDYLNDVRFNSLVADAKNSEPPKAKSKPDADGKIVEPEDPLKEYRDAEPRELDIWDVAVPQLILQFITLPLGFCLLYLMRSMGLFTYYHQPELELVSAGKEATWDESKIKRDEFGQVIDTRSSLYKFYKNYEGMLNTMAFFIIIVLIAYAIWFFKS